MRALLDFFIRHSTWLVFALCASISLVMLFNGNPFQRHVFMTSASAVASTVYEATENVTGYFNLREINEDLQQRTSQLELEVISLRRRLRDANEQLTAQGAPTDSTLAPYRFIMAHVINNSVVHSNNFITLNRGAADGIRPEMGVMDQNGIVGIVNAVGPHSCRVISLLNSDLRLSCKLKNSDAFGSLVWDGRSSCYAVLEELPRHEHFAVGDTIVTSGFSAVFPEGIPVGKVVGHDGDDDANFYTLRIRLFTDFGTLSTVRVIENFMKEEITAVEQDQVNTSGQFK